MIEAVEIPARDGRVLRGQLRRGGTDWVVLVHDLGEDLDAWRSLAPALVERKLSVLAYDLRGHGGSDGEVDSSQTAADVATVVAFARAEGAKRVYLGTAGRSTRPAIEAGAAEGCEALFALAPVGEDLGRTPPLAKLAIAGSRDPEQDAAGTELARSPGWTVVIRVPLADPGCGMLEGNWAANVRDYALTFLKQRRFGPAPTRPRHAPVRGELRTP